MKRLPLAVALVHHPVIDRRGDRITTAVTNLDLHDIARTARTYGVERFFIVTPVAEQQALVARVLGHWQDGYGATYNTDRREALSLARCVASLPEALAAWERETGLEPMPVLTGARCTDGMSFGRCRELGRQKPIMLILGTGWGLAPELFEAGWAVLEPVRGAGDYNHLPVRAAAAIILDRLLGDGGRVLEQVDVSPINKSNSDT